MEGPEELAFALDEQEGKATPSPKPTSTPGCSTPSRSGHSAGEVALERRVIPLLEFHSDVCSICLEEYTASDPGAPTVCGHHYHLQCIMQWAQRSRECPLCFKTLQLEDDDMNTLLPFGEYVSPQQRAAEASSLESWELERLLVRLAAAASQREHRHRSRHDRAAAAGRHRRQGSRGEASAPQPIHASAASEGAPTARWSLPGEGGADGGAAEAAADSGRRRASAPGPAYPSSWPPAAGLEGGSGGASVGGSMHDDGHVVSPASRPGSLSLKSRLASLKLKDKFDKTTKDLKSLFSPGGSSSGRGGAGSAAMR